MASATWSIRYMIPRDFSAQNPTGPRQKGPIDRARLLLVVWNGPEASLASRIRIGLIDFFIICLAIALPWSTTVATGLALAIMPMLLATHGPGAMARELKRPACSLPIALVGLAIVGMAWATGVQWSDRLHALQKVIKLIWILPLVVHFRVTKRALQVLAAYVVSNLVLLALSFLVFLSSDISALVGNKEPGVPVKSYIDQSQAFCFVAVLLLGLAGDSFRNGRKERAIIFLAISIAFFLDLTFVNVARTAFFYMPAMLGLVVLRYTRGVTPLVVLAGSLALGIGLWAASPILQSKVARLVKEVDAFEANADVIDGYPAGGAERLEFWRKSIGFIRTAPILGHGTGSTNGLFAAEAAGKTGIMAKVVDNPHNQFLAVTIQWGTIGSLLLLAMWAAHLMALREGLTGNGSLAAWIGLVAVVQNITSSALNSHLFDFYPGWLYLTTVAIVLGGGLTGAEANTSSGDQLTERSGDVVGRKWMHPS